MTPEEFQKFYPLLADWLRTTLAAHEGAAQTVASRGFLRLPLYFTAENFSVDESHLNRPIAIPTVILVGTDALCRF